MKNEDYAAQKLAYEMDQAKCATQASTSGLTQSGALGGMNACEPMRENLVGRIRNASYRATKEAMKADKLRELEYLLDKNPEVARILTLLDEVDSRY